MQLNPARGRKLAKDGLVLIGVSGGLCSSTPRGDGNGYKWWRMNPSYLAVYAAQPREGTETLLTFLISLLSCGRRFMQLNPARGRKLDACTSNSLVFGSKVYAAQPREGTETLLEAFVIKHNLPVYAAQPREGTETRPRWHHTTLYCSTVYAAQPREGTETNYVTDLLKEPEIRVYAAQPREGTETPHIEHAK